MIKILNKLFYILKNILLVILMLVTTYIVSWMFKRLGKELFGSNFLEFIGVLLPYLLLLITILLNTFLNHDNVKNNFFYNITSFLVMITISVFCYRALMDQNMYLWHQYGYKINFNYFADQIAPMKVMLYGLLVGNILLVIDHYIKDDNKEIKTKTKTKKVNKK